MMKTVIIRLKRKKNGFFLKTHWTDYITLTIIIALFVLIPDTCSSSTTDQADSVVFTDDAVPLAKNKIQNNGILRQDDRNEELNVLRKEFFEILKKSERQKKEYQKLQLSIAATIKSAEKINVTDREAELIASLNKITDKAKKLAVDTQQFCQYLDSVLDKLKIDKLERLRIKYRLDDLRNESEDISVMLSQKVLEKRTDKCRILAINEQLQVVVLTAGSIHGIRNGLKLRLENDTILKVIAVRPYVAAAMVIEGNLEELTPGMVVYTGNVNKTTN